MSYGCKPLLYVTSLKLYAANVSFILTILSFVISTFYSMEIQRLFLWDFMKHRNNYLQGRYGMIKFCDFFKWFYWDFFNFISCW